MCRLSISDSCLSVCKAHSNRYSLQIVIYATVHVNERSKGFSQLIERLGIGNLSNYTAIGNE
jgi:hypothetical protein